jgi:hypothetical protein
LAEASLTLQNVIESRDAALAPSAVAQADRAIRDVDRRIDAAAYGLFELSADEIAIVET